MEKKVITVGKDGTIKFVYEEHLAERLDKEGVAEKHIERLSNVEPNEEGKWEVQFTDSDTPDDITFDKRSDAITYEIDKAQTLLKKGELCIKKGEE